MALRAAARKGDAEMVADMLTRKPGALDSALIDAASGGHTAVVQTLIDKGAIVNARWRDSRTALTLAAVEASVATVQLLLARGADIAATFDDGKTAPHEVLDR